MPDLLSCDQLAEVQAAQQELLAIRRHLHAHPELSGNEHQTAALVAGELRNLGLRVQEGVGRTGVVAELGSGVGPWWLCGWTWTRCRWRSAPACPMPR